MTLRVGVHVGQLLQRTPGGIGRYTQALVEHLPAAGVAVVPFAAGDPSVHRLTSLPGFVDLGHPYGSLRYELWHLLARPRVRLPVDVVHAPSLAVPPSGATPLVVTVHDLVFLRFPETLTPHGVRFHRRGLSLARRYARAVIVPSRFTRDELVAEGFEIERIHVIPHGVTVGAPPTDDEIERRLARVGVTPPFVLAVGTIEPRKGLDVLAHAMQTVVHTHPALSLVIAGPRGWGDVHGLDAPFVRELGAVDEHTLDALFRRASLCAAPSRYEGFGLPTLEAMARGCPVIASNIASLPEVVGDAGELVPVGDVDAWVTAIEALLDDPARAQRLAEEASARAASFTWDAAASAHATVYAETVKTQRRS